VAIRGGERKGKKAKNRATRKGRWKGGEKRGLLLERHERKKKKKKRGVSATNNGTSGEVTDERGWRRDWGGDG